MTEEPLALAPSAAAAVAVVGGGIAGSATVLHLLLRGVPSIALYESSPDLTSSTSSVIAGTVSFDRFYRFLDSGSDDFDDALKAMGTSIDAVEGSSSDERERMTSFVANAGAIAALSDAGKLATRRRVYRESHALFQDVLKSYPELCSVVIGGWCCEVGGEAAAHVGRALNETDVCTRAPGAVDPFGTFRLLPDETCASARRDVDEYANERSTCDDASHLTESACLEAGHGYQEVGYTYHGADETRRLVGDFVLDDPNVGCSIVEGRLTGYARTEELFELLQRLFESSPSVTLKLGSAVTALAPNDDASISVSSESSEGGGAEVRTYDAAVVAASVASVPLLRKIDPGLSDHLVAVRGNGLYGAEADETPIISREQRGRAVVFERAAANRRAAYARAQENGKAKIWGGAFVNASDSDVRPPYSVLSEIDREILFSSDPAPALSKLLNEAGASMETCVRPVPSLGPLPLMKRYGGAWGGNLYLNTGYGFNGYDLAWFSGDCVASMVAGDEEEVGSACRDALFDRATGDLASMLWSESDGNGAPEASSTSMHYVSIVLVAVITMLLSMLALFRRRKVASAVRHSRGPVGAGAGRTNGKGPSSKGSARMDFAELQYVCALQQTQKSVSPPVRMFNVLIGRLVGKEASDVDDQANLAKVAADIFDQIDEDGSGYLDREEMFNATKMMVELDIIHLDGSTVESLTDRLFEECDDNGDGKIDILEFRTLMKETAKRYDNKARGECSILAEDIRLFLRSRYNIVLDKSAVSSMILPGLSIPPVASEDIANAKLDLVEVASTIMIPPLLQARKERHSSRQHTVTSSLQTESSEGMSSIAKSSSLDIIEHVLLIILRDLGHGIISDGEQYPVLDEILLEDILNHYGEVELASNKQLLRQIIDEARHSSKSQSSASPRLTPDVFAHIMTADVLMFDPEEDDFQENPKVGTEHAVVGSFWFSSSAIDSTASLFKSKATHSLIWVFMAMFFMAEWLSGYSADESMVESGVRSMLKQGDCPEIETAWYGIISGADFGCQLKKAISIWGLKIFVIVILGFVAVWCGSLANTSNQASRSKAAGLACISIVMLICSILPLVLGFVSSGVTNEMILYSQVSCIITIGGVCAIYTVSALTTVNSGSLSFKGRALDQAAQFKANLIIENALRLHDAIQTSPRRDLRPANQLLGNVMIKFQAQALNSGADGQIGFIDCWRRYLSGDLIHQDGVRISARLMAINAVQVFVAGLLLLSGMKFSQAVVGQWEDLRKGSVISDIVFYLAQRFGFNLDDVGPRVCDGAGKFIDSSLTEGKSCERITQAVLDAVMAYTSGSLMPLDKNMIIAPLILFTVLSVSYTLFLGAIFIYEATNTVMRFRAASIPFFDNANNFVLYRERLDRPFELIGTLLWCTIFGPIMFAGFWALLLFLCLWQVTKGVASRAIASLLAITITYCIRWGFGVFFVDPTVKGFYRERVNQFNLGGLAVESIMIGLGIALAVFRLLCCLSISLLYIARADKMLFENDVTFGLGHPFFRTRDHLPVIFRKEILLQEAHHHPYINSIGRAYMMKLKYGDRFANSAGCCMRVIFTQALMPWLRRYRVMARRDIVPDASVWRRVSTHLSLASLEE